MLEHLSLLKIVNLFPFSVHGEVLVHVQVVP